MSDDLQTQLRLSRRFADCGDWETAIEHAQRATRIAPWSAIAGYELGNLLKDTERFHAAADCYRNVIACDPGFAEAILNLGIVSRHLGETDQALACFEKLFPRAEFRAQAHLQRALTRLTAGDLGAGWDEYEWRWQAEAERRQFPYPDWDGSSPANKTILVHAEQGIGDQIQFASCLPDVVAKVERCIVECEDRLVPLFARSFPGCKINSTNDQCKENGVTGSVAQRMAPRSRIDEPHTRGTIDCQIPLASLQRFFRRRFTEFPTTTGYLQPDPARVEKWQQRFTELGSEMKIGISWRGGSNPETVRSRSTSLVEWRSILRAPKVQFINLQYGETAGELRRCADDVGVTVRDWTDADPLTDLDDFAAQVAALDLVISIDNSTVHMAGALGVPVWTLLPFAADFRWMQGTARSPWYPSMRLYRQIKPRDWSAVFAAVGNELSLKAAGMRAA